MVRGFLIFLPLPLTRMLDSSESLSAFKLATVSHVGSSSGHPESFNGPHYGRARPGDSYHPPITPQWAPVNFGHGLCQCCNDAAFMLMTPRLSSYRTVSLALNGGECVC